MKKKIEKVFSLTKNPLISGSTILFFGWFIGNFINYLFNLVMGRLLVVSDYGLMVSLSSLFVFFGIFILTFSSTFAKFVAVHHANKNKKGIGEIILHGTKILIVFSLLLFAVLSVSTPLLAGFLHVTNISYLFLIYIAICFAILFSVPFGVLQGQMRFYLLSFVNGMQAVLKLIFGTLFVILGMKVLGALFGIVIGAVVPTAVILIFLVRPHAAHVNRSFFSEWTVTKELMRYGSGFFMSAIGVTILSSTDIILVRHFFSPVVSGQYAALSLMGKAIFYLVGPIGLAFFPLIAYKKEKKESVTPVLFMTIGIVCAASLALSFIYFVFPHLVLAIFFPKAAYKILDQYLGIFSLYIFVFSLLSLFNSFFLSLGKTSVYKITLSAAILQTILIFIFHDSIYQIVGVLFASSFIGLLLLLFFYMRYTGINYLVKVKLLFVSS